MCRTFCRNVPGNVIPLVSDPVSNTKSRSPNTTRLELIDAGKFTVVAIPQKNPNCSKSSAKWTPCSWASGNDGHSGLKCPTFPQFQQVARFFLAAFSSSDMKAHGFFFLVPSLAGATAKTSSSCPSASTLEEGASAGPYFFSLFFFFGLTIVAAKTATSEKLLIPVADTVAPLLFITLYLSASVTTSSTQLYTPFERMSFS